MATKPRKTIPTVKIRWALRKLWLWSPEWREAKRRARVARGLYLCAICKKLHKKVQVDHITPVGKFINWDTYINNLFCEVSNLRVLCKDCHLKVTD